MAHLDHDLVQYHKFHIKIAKSLVKWDITPDEVCEVLVNDIQSHGSERTQFKLCSTTLEKKRKLTANPVDLIAYLVNRWARERLGGNLQNLCKLFSGRSKIQIGLKQLCGKSLRTRNCDITKCQELPLLEISTKKGNLYAFCEKHDSPGCREKNSKTPWCFYQDCSSSSEYRSTPTRKNTSSGNFDSRRMPPVQIVNVFNFVDYEESNRKRKREEEIDNIIAENPLKKARKNDEPSEHSNGAKHNSETNYAAKVKSPSEERIQMIMTDKPTLYQLAILKWKEPNKQKHIEIMKRLASKWKWFGMYLKLDKDGNELTRIGRERSNFDSYDCIQELMQLWLRGQGIPATWETLIHTLRDADFEDLAGEVEEYIKEHSS